MRSVLLALMVCVLAGQADAATLAVDFGNDRGTATGPDATAAGVDPAFATTTDWDLVDIASATNSVTVALSQNLAATQTIELTITANTAGFFTSAAGLRDFDPLRNDYIVGNATSQQSTLLEFSLSGLDAGREYGLYLHASDANFANRQSNVRADGDGDGVIDPVNALLISGDTQNSAAFTDVYLPTVTADALGRLRWEIEAIGAAGLANEINLAGFQVSSSPVPLPAAGWMLLAGIGAIAWRGRGRAV